MRASRTPQLRRTMPSFVAWACSTSAVSSGGTEDVVAMPVTVRMAQSVPARVVRGTLVIP
jgi:hypothetical protein